ncbi:hypothetical protein I79_017060 [Cricetulus griseus]|uniref:Uncharacterized protein n=1 Tax=Cricetulus griseus TaxID=10029 RepID=G3I117_CRIGR|nr:hypothetical protein I79_017060 [Cricetulus griseus]
MDYTAAINLVPHARSSGCLKDPNPNALTLGGATPLEGARAFWQLRELEPQRGGTHKDYLFIFQILGCENSLPTKFSVQSGAVYLMMVRENRNEQRKSPGQDTARAYLQDPAPLDKPFLLLTTSQLYHTFK